MRLRLSIETDSRLVLPINYQHYLTAVIYDLIARASQEHAAWLHDRGFGSDKRPFKHFTFSKLYSDPRPELRDPNILLGRKITWLVSMHVEVTLMNFVTGIFEKQGFWIGREEYRCRIVQVEAVPEPEFKDRMKFICLSPILVKKPFMKGGPRNGKLQAKHLLPDDPEVSQFLKRNLVNKFESLYGLAPKEMLSARFEFVPDREYILRRGGVQRVTKLITLYAGKPEETKHRAFECPFFLQTHPELMRLAYDSGLGNDNAMGFGMIETINNGEL
jgi:CRISPR-associated endoribonuclease Cas6